MNFSIKPIAGIVLALVAGLAQATTIDFTTSKVSVGKSFDDITDGFDFTSNSAIGVTMTKSALAETIGTTLTVTSATGAFDLSSLDLADVLNLGLSNKVVLNYTTETGATGTETLTLDKKRGFQTFDLASDHLDDLKSFTLKGGSGITSFQLDNLDVTAVPEPGSLALFLAGLGLVGTVARRRKA